MESDATPATAEPPFAPTPGRRFGYLVAVVVNAALLFAVRHLLEWDVLPFLTEDFDRVVPWISLSLIVAMAVNLLFMWSDRGWHKPLGDLVQTGFSLVATVKLYRVFPFDYSADDVAWAGVTRVVLIVLGIVTALAAVANAVTLARMVGTPSTQQAS